MLGLKLNHVSKRGHRHIELVGIRIHIWRKLCRMHIPYCLVSEFSNIDMTDLSVFFCVASLALEQTYDCASASEWIWVKSRLVPSHNNARTMCIIPGVYCILRIPRYPIATRIVHDNLIRRLDKKKVFQFTSNLRPISCRDCNGLHMKNTS